MPTRNEKVAAQLAECRAQRNHLARIVDDARAILDEVKAAHADAVAVSRRAPSDATKLAVTRAWVDVRAARDLMVEASMTASIYDAGLMLRGVDLSKLL